MIGAAAAFLMAQWAQAPLAFAIPAAAIAFAGIMYGAAKVQALRAKPEAPTSPPQDEHFGQGILNRILERPPPPRPEEHPLQAAVKAKARLMRDRLSTRNHLFGDPRYDSPRTTSYLAAMWDAEERGHFYDEYHRSTFMPMGTGAPKNLPGDTIAELQRNVIAYKEKRRQANLAYQTERRRALVDKGRDLAHEFTRLDRENQMSEDADYFGFREFLERQRIFADIEPHLSDKFLRKLHAQRTIYLPSPEAAYPVLVSEFLGELKRLEKEWGLVRQSGS
jgi:hypothetical protein